MGNEVSNSEFIKRLYDVRGDEYALIGEYEHCKKKVTLLHNVCGLTTDILPSNATSCRLPIPCKYCNPYSKKDTDVYAYQLNKAFPGEFEVIGDYIGANRPITLKHNNCGKVNTYEYASTVLSGISHCPFCHKGANINTDSFRYKLYQMYNGEYDLISDYINTRSDVTIRHNQCGHKYDANANDILRGKSLCPICSKYSSLKTKDSINIELKEKYHNRFVLLDDFKTVNDIHSFLCNSCKNIVDLRVSHALTDTVQCPICGHGISYPAKIMRSLLNQLNISYIPEYSRKHCLWCEQYRYDFYLPNYNWIIEVHGLQHYYGGWDLESVQKNDIIKESLARNNGIDKYIIIDARFSDFEYIKNNIINSDLSLLGLDDIDWSLCDLNSNKSYFKSIVDLWESGFEVSEISDKLHISVPTISRKLKNANASELLTRKYGGYSTARAKATIIRNSKKVMCLETQEVFNSAKEADCFYNPNHISKGNVGHCANGQQHTAYGLHWQYI